MMHGRADLNGQIAATELRIKARKQRMTNELLALRETARNGLTSPSTLLFAAGAGFVLGRITDRARAPGESRLSRTRIAVSDAVKGALGLLQTPAFLWIARLFGNRDGAADRAQGAASLDLPAV